MTVNYTTLLGLAQPVTGTESNAWGDVVNDQITALVEEAVAGGETIDVTAGNVTLSTTVGLANQARNAILLITGTPGTSRDVIAPSQSKVYLVKNSSDAAVVLKGAATTGVTIPAGVEALCFFNGSDFEITGVNGPASSTDNAVARFDSTTGKVIQNSGVTIDDSNNISGVAQLNATTVDATNVEVTNIKAKDGTASVQIADSTGVVSITAAPVLTALTASQAVFTNASKALVSNAITGSGNVVMSTSPTLVTPILGTPQSGTLTNATGLPIVAGTTGTLSVARGGTGVTTSTGTGDVVLSTSPTLITPVLGTPQSATLTNATGLPTAGLVDNAVTDPKLRDSVALSVIGRSANSTGDPADIAAGTDHQVLRRSGTTLAFGSISLNQSAAVTGTLPVGNGGTGITSFGTGVATFLGTPSSANLAAAVTDETGTGALVFATSPTLVTPVLGTPQSGTLTNATGLPLSTGVTGTLPVANGGTGQTTYTNGQLLIGNTTGNTLAKATLTAGTGITVTNGAGAITVAATNNGTVTSVGGTGTVQGLSLSGTVTSSGNLTLGGSLSAVSLTTQVSGTLAVANGGTGITSLGTGVATFLGTPSSANLASAVTDETGTGALVFATSPTLVTPVLGTPTSGTLSGCTVDGTDAVGFRTIPQNSQSAAYTLVLADSGKHIFHPVGDNNARTFTIPANSSVAYPVGTALTFINMAVANVTIAITTDTLKLSPAGTTGSRTLATNGSATCIKITSTEWIISGSGLT